MGIRKAVKSLGVLAILMVALTSYSSTAHSTVLFEKYYNAAGAKGIKPVEGNYANGYRSRVQFNQKHTRMRSADALIYPVSPGEHLNPSSGSLVFKLKYENPHPAGMADDEVLESLFNFVDDKGKYLMGAQILWPHSPSVSNYIGRDFGGISFFGAGWSGWVPFDHEPKIGETLTITITWDGANNRVYLNDRPLNKKYVSFVDNVDAPVNSLPFGEYLQSARMLRIGTYDDNTADYNGPMFSGSIAEFQIHNKALVPVVQKPVIASVSDDTFKVPGISGKLVAGDTVTATLVAVAGGTATFDMGKVKGVAMEPVPVDNGAPGRPAVLPGTYRGSYTIKPGDDFENGQIAGQFLSVDNVAADPVLSVSKWTIETRPVVTFKMDKKDLPADAGTKSRIKLVAKDANGNPVKARKLKLTLATTDEYTGTVGAGDFGKQVGASVETRWKGETDTWGEVDFDYVAGFAAKTVILQAKDLDSGYTSVDYLTAYKEASIDIALTPPRSLAAARRGMQYVIKVEASRTVLTADGRSRSVIKATVLDPNGKPVAGDTVTFSLSSENGTVRAVYGTTDASGVATGEYVAGKKIGIVVVTATDTVRNISGNVSILLLADAPAKIILKARPESLPADGNSRADISVKVTDINDNPNKDTKVEFKLTKGVGKLDAPSKVTDNFGEAVERFTAGTTPGIATVLATVRSRIPNDVELAKAKNVLFAPYNDTDEEIRVEKWLKKKGDTALLGEAVLTYTVGRDRTVKTLVAPFDLKVVDTFVETWDKAEIGQSLATVLPVTVN